MNASLAFCAISLVMLFSDEDEPSTPLIGLEQPRIDNKIIIDKLTSKILFTTLASFQSQNPDNTLIEFHLH